MKGTLRHSQMMKKCLTRRQLLQAGLAGIGTLGVWSLAACSPTPTASPPAATAPAIVKTPVPQSTQAPTAVATQVSPAQPTQPSASPAAAAKRGGNLIAAGTGEIKFDPYFQIVPLRFVTAQIFGRLVDYMSDDLTKIRPQIAESWEETDKVLTIKLRQGVKFHNGREIVAQDVVDNIARAKDKSIGHYLFNTFDSSVDGAEAIDKYAVRITYKKPYPVKLDDLATLYLIPKEAMSEIATKPVGSGPFKFGSYTPGDKLEMSRFDQYWETGKPYLDKVTVKIIPDPQARVANLLSGSVDIVDTLPLADAARLQKEDKVQVVGSLPGGTWYANVLNCAKKPFDNKLVRQAMNFSIDRDKINKLAYFGLAPVTQCRYLPSSPWYNEKAATMYKFDLQRAKALLQQAGYPDGFKTSIAVSEAVLPGSKAMAQVWAQDLEKIGVKLEILEREQGPFYDEYFNGNYEIQAYGLGDGKLDPSTYLLNGSPYRPTNNKANIQGQPFYERYVKLIDESVSTIDPKKRKPITDQIQELIAEEGWVITTAFWVSFTGLTKRVQGFRLPIDATYDFTGIWLAQ